MQITQQIQYKMYNPKTRETFIYMVGQDVKVKQGRRWFFGFIFDICIKTQQYYCKRSKSQKKHKDLIVKVQTEGGRIIRTINPTGCSIQLNVEALDSEYNKQVQEVNELEAKIKKLKQSIKHIEETKISMESAKFYRDLRSIRSEVVKLNKNK